MKYLAVARVLKKQRPSVDNFVLHLHYRFTFLIFLIASSLVMAKEYFGKPIACLKNGIPNSVLDIYCFIMSTFSLPKGYGPERVGKNSAFEGLGINLPDDEVVYHAYYQWVPIVLFLQAVVFYLPRYLWKSAEGGLFDVVLGGLHKPQTDSSKKAKQYKVLSKYMLENLNMHTGYAFSFFACEVVSFVVVICQIFFTNRFLGGTFLDYGSDVVNMLEMPEVNRTDPMIRIFPTVAKCNFRHFGPSGTVSRIDTMCVLAVNILNQKIYILLWFWLVILAAITGLWLLYRLATILSPQFRYLILKTRGAQAGPQALATVRKHLSLGDWFLLHQLGRVTEPTVFGEFLAEFAQALDTAAETRPMLYPPAQ